MPVVLARVDERLVHGVTVNQWNSELHPKRYMVVDDEISHNDMIKATMRESEKEEKYSLFIRTIYGE